MAPPLSEAVAEMATAVPETMALLDGAVIETVGVAVQLALVAVRVTVEDAALVGVPEWRPLVASSASPAGTPVAAQLVAVSVADIGSLNAAPTWLVAVPVMVMAGVAGVIVTASV